MGDNLPDFNDEVIAKGPQFVKVKTENCLDAAKGIPFAPFIVKPCGVFSPGKPDENGDSEDKLFCSYLMPVGMATDAKGSNYALMFEMKDPDGRTKKITIRMEDSQAKGGEAARILFVRNGGSFAHGVRAKSLFSDFMNAIIRSAKNLPRIVIADSSGWVTVDRQWRFVLPGTSFYTIAKESKK